MDNLPNERDASSLDHRGRHPHWVELLGMPVWVTGADGTIAYMNARAETLIGKEARACMGRPCHEVIGGQELDGTPFCSSDCAVRRLAANGREIEPYPLRIPRTEQRDEVLRVVVIVSRLPGDAGTCYVHCVIDDARHERFRGYLDRVMARSHRPSELSLDSFALTRREREVLRLLAQDESLHAIAHKLNLSYATVRNHSQHILNKLRVHSIIEAVALYLLMDD